MDLDLIEWQQTARIVSAEPSYSLVTYPGAAPQLIQQPTTLRILSQAGRAVGWGKRMIPPNPLPGTLIAPPEYGYAKLDQMRWETTWSYVLAVDAGVVIDTEAAAAWPSDPQWHEDLLA